MKRNRMSVCGLMMVVLWVGVILAGCGGGGINHYGSASIVSDPPQANVVSLEDGSTIGTTPMQYTWDTADVSEKYIQLKLTTAGHTDQVTEFFLNSRYGSRESAEETPQVIKVKMNPAE